MSKQNNSRGGESVAPFDMKGRIPPQALEMEQAVLGALLLERGAMDKIEGVLKPETFYKEGNRCVYEAMLELSLQKEPIDLLTVKNHLSQSGKLDAAGGFYYLVELTSKVASAANIEYHARIIVQKHIAREIIKIGDGMVHGGYDETTDILALIKDVQDAIGSLDSGKSKVVGMDFAEAVAESEKDLELIGEGNSVFFPPLPFMPGYTFGAGEVATIAADSGTGKTAIGMEWALRVTGAFPALFNSLEMTPKQLAMREMAMAAGVDGFRMRLGNLSVEQWRSWDHLKRVKRLRVVQCWDVSSLVQAVIAFRKELGLSADDPIAVVNDYIQLMVGKGNNTEERLANISGDLKQAALDNNFFLINLAQLNKEWVNKPDKKPTVHNIRGCDKIRHDSDFVFIPHRPEFYTASKTDEQGNLLAGQGMIIIGKSRIGILNNTFEINTMIHDGKWMSPEAFSRLSLPPRAVPFHEAIKDEDEGENYDLKNWL